MSIEKIEAVYYDTEERTLILKNGNGQSFAVNVDDDPDITIFKNLKSDFQKVTSDMSSFFKGTRKDMLRDLKQWVDSELKKEEDK